MNCPQCKQDHSEDMISTPRTQRFESFDIREHLCLHCGKRWTSIARPDTVFVFNPVTGKEEQIPFDIYVKLYRDYDMGLSKHPAAIRQGSLFDETI